VTTEQDRFEALIEEARQRARRRRQTYGAIAVGIAAVAAAIMAIDGSDATSSEPSGLSTPAGTAATAPTG
jgi:ferric-dicitrate binding protein FerR (iron transport regulator)